jgi:hypothetical protein
MPSEPHTTDPELADVLDRVALARDGVAELLHDLRGRVTREVARVVEEQASAGGAVPTVDVADLAAGAVADETVQAVRRRGCVVVRGTFERAEAEDWDREIAEYLAVNRFEERYAALEPERAATGSRIWGIYWSKPQVRARQHERMTTVRRFLNGFWAHESDGTTWFDPANDIGYPDRLRRRAPGVPSVGLRPHVDAPSSGGWRIPENRRVFRHVLAGEPERYDPWDAAHRTTFDVDSPAPSSVFRTFQGWTALSEMQPDDGVLHIVPIPDAIAYLLLAGIAGELGLLGVPEPAPRRVTADDVLLPALVPIPAVEPGDTVWWHGDLVHSVGDASNHERWGNVMYVGAAPPCERNDRYASTMLDRFVRGASPVDFPPEDHEVDFVGRAGLADLDAEGRRRFGLAATP